MTLLNKTYNNITDVFGRLLIGGLFAYAGFGKILGFSGTAGWMASMGVPAAELLLVLTIILELVGGLMLIVGFKTKEIAFLLAGFVLIASLIFHNPLDPDQNLYFIKNMMIMGGLLVISGRGSAEYAVDK